jgi:hypothetical protein
MPKMKFALIALALVAVTSACSAVPGATPTPSVPPTPTPVPTPTPSPTFGPDQVEHPTGATDIVLRMESGGGFVPINFFITQAPAFTLYGDGTVIFQQIDNRNGDPFGGQANLPWLVGHLDEAQMQSILQFALTTGRLANAKENYDEGGIADAPSTFFTINAGGVDKTVNVYALGIEGQPGPDTVDRQGFSQLAEVLNNIPAQPGIDVGDVQPYDAALYKVVLLENFGQPAVQPKDWPWDDLTPADWPANADDPGSRIKMLDKEHLAKLLDVPNGGHIGVWVTEPDGTTVVQLGVRPLLPDEIEAFNSGN